MSRPSRLPRRVNRISREDLVQKILTDPQKIPLIEQGKYLWSLLDGDLRAPILERVDRATFGLPELSLEDSEKLIFYFTTEQLNLYEADIFPEWFNGIYAYNGDQKIYFTESLSLTEDQRVFLGKLNGVEVVVKWVPDDTALLKDEIEAWKLVKSTGAATPWLNFDFKFMGLPVLVLERLYPLDSTDDPLDIAYQLLPELERIHTRGIHNDIKPDNILKTKVGDRDPEGRQIEQTEYFLMDYGGFTTEPLGYGFKRMIWSPYWASQIEQSGQVTTAWNDLLELGYTMIFWDDKVNDRQKGYRTRIFGEYSPRTTPIENSRIQEYMNLVNLGVPGTSPDYEKLMKILE